MSAHLGPAPVPDDALGWLIPLLACPRCRGPLSFVPDTGTARDGLLRHDGAECSERYPVIDGIPRMLRTPHRRGLVAAKREWFGLSPARAALGASWDAPHGEEDRVVAAFDHEWSLFRAPTPDDARAVYQLYFDLVRPAELSSGALVLDAGCGSGRWAREIAARGPRVVALDLGMSIEVARENLRGSARVACVQGDLNDLPLADGAVDWAYSLGVLHHLNDPDRAMRHVVRAVRPAGRVLVYVYYALDQRGAVYRSIFRAADALRRRTSRLPRRVVLLVASAIALLVYWPLARASRVLAALGLRALADGLPLAFYRDRSLRTMLNDSLDRFGTSVERRYTRDAFERLLAGAGLSAVTISPGPPYWHGMGARPSGG